MTSPISGPAGKPFNAASKAQEKANIKQMITFAKKKGWINTNEANELTKLVNEGFGSKTLVKDYLVNYKKNGKSIEQFVADTKANAN